MISGRVALLQRVLEQGIGAEVVVELQRSRLRTGLRSHFAGLTRNQGPVCTVTPSGLRRHHVEVRFGSFGGECISQMQQAPSERWVVARALVEGVASINDVIIRPGQRLDSWTITDSGFGVDVVVRDVDNPSGEAALIGTAEKVMVPLMAAMAELIGYDESEAIGFDVEGALTSSTIARRERSPRNRLLCLSIHGHRCVACGMQPKDHYAEAGDIIEVHHLEPVSLLSEPRPYDPRTDLVPLCPSCHRAVHRRYPVPYSIEELKELMRRAGS